jgi:FkbM family methyltransferase
MKTFLEIGTCDFQTLGYLTDLGWKGIMIEPIPKYYQSLTSQSLHPNCYYINAAIDWKEGERKMYMASDEQIQKLPYSVGMSSFFPKPDILSEEIMVKTLTLDKVFNICNVERVDFLKIDAEGYDYEIIKMFPFDKFKPTHVKVEKEHMDDVMLADTLTILSSNGYHCEWTERDIFAFLVI